MPSPIGRGGVGARCSTLAAPLLALLCFACGSALDSGPAGGVQACPSAILQVGNTSPCPRFATKQSNELLSASSLVCNEAVQRTGRQPHWRGSGDSTHG